MTTSPGFQQFKLSFEISPIILVGGIAANLPGAILPIISITQPGFFAKGVTSLGASGLVDNDTTDTRIGSLDDFFANFIPMPGSTLIDQDLGRYPFANMAVAANATISNPLLISLLMICPVRDDGGYADKFATFTNVKSQLDAHNNQGGTYTVATPSYLYTNCILKKLVDVSGGESKQVQDRWQWDFERPLLTLKEAQAAQNSQMQRITNGAALSGDPPPTSGTAPAVGIPSSGQGPVVVPAAANLQGSSASGPGSISEGFA